MSQGGLGGGRVTGGKPDTGRQEGDGQGREGLGEHLAGERRGWTGKKCYSCVEERVIKESCGLEGKTGARGSIHKKETKGIGGKI